MQSEDAVNDRSLRKLHSDRPLSTSQFEKYLVAWGSDRRSGNQTSRYDEGKQIFLLSVDLWTTTTSSQLSLENAVASHVSEECESLSTTF